MAFAAEQGASLAFAGGATPDVFGDLRERGSDLALLGDLLTRGDAETVDHDLGLRLTARPGPDTVITSQ